jgi:hypothetical protein
MAAGSELGIDDVLDGDLDDEDDGELPLDSDDEAFDGSLPSDLEDEPVMLDSDEGEVVDLEDGDEPESGSDVEEEDEDEEEEEEQVVVQSSSRKNKRKASGDLPPALGPGKKSKKVAFHQKLEAPRFVATETEKEIVGILKPGKAAKGGKGVKAKTGKPGKAEKPEKKVEKKVEKKDKEDKADKVEVEKKTKAVKVVAPVKKSVVVKGTKTKGDRAKPAEGEAYDFGAHFF